MIIIQLKKGKDAPLKRFHPWVFSGAIAKIIGKPEDGDTVEVQDASGNFLALGHYQNGSITVRLFTFEKELIDVHFWQKKLQQAHDFRKAIGIIDQEKTNAYRLVHAEGDGLPGLIIDVYNGHAVVQCHSIGMHKVRQELATALLQIYGSQLITIFDKSAETLPANYGETIENTYLYGKDAQAVVLENDNAFFVDWEAGQKTGFFLDQRNNRELLGSFAKGKAILNTFCYSGGFSVYALNQGATFVHSVDASAKAIEWTDKNVALTGREAVHESFVGDVLKFFKKEDLPEYDIVIVDPPAFAKNIKKRHNAVQGYKRLNAMALKRIKKGGILFTFSCSQVVSRELFYNTITAAAIEAGRHVRVMHFLSQPADHPVSLFHPEGEYLKGLVLYVE